MSPIEIAEDRHKQFESQPKTSTPSPEQQQEHQPQQEEQQQKEQQSQQESERATQDINNNTSNHRKRSCSSTSSSLATEKRRSARLLKKHIEEEQQHQQDQTARLELCKKGAASMLSKMKQTAAVADSRASSFSHTQNNNNNNNNNNSDTEDNNNDVEHNDSNNNQVESAPVQPGKLTQDELMDIVEVSRRRRLSKGSADTLGSFIQWSFTHVESHEERRRRDSFSLFEKQNTLVIENNNNTQTIKALAREADDGEPLDEEDDWSTLAHRNERGKFATTEQLLRQHAKLSAVAQCGGSSAANLALLRHQSSLIAAQEGGTRLIKRPRTHMHSTEAKLRLGSPTGERRKVSTGYLGNVVERLHQQQQEQKVATSVQRELDASGREQESSSGLSYHLQQFLSQQTSLEDLCSSVGLDDSNQLVLAAAIHRALVDSVGSSGGQANEGVGSKSTASSNGGSSIGSSTNSGGAAAGANPHQVDSLTGRRRTYNTRGAGLATSLGASALEQGQQLANRQHSGSTAATLAALNINSRAQQQRHAQAAAALSALANAGSHHNHESHQHNSHHHVAPSTPISNHFPLSGMSAAMGNQSTTTGLSLTGGSAASNGAGGNPMVDFECDTCGSSFDDRHRLMQHQSIHLELKKDWFTETPVDEVMKIFNRRRGEFLCNTCNLRFEATFDYDKHNHQVHGQRPYCCQFCGNGTRTFRFWRQYLNHLYDHRYIFSCTIEDCDFTVNRRDSLRFHIFRFHLNCQLPQQQTHIRSAGHQHNMMLTAGDSTKWPHSMGVHHGGPDDDVDDLDQDSDLNIGD